MRMLFKRNDSYHHLIISKILKSFLFNFPNWCFLRETCAYPHFPMWKNHECCLPLNIFSSWVFGFGPPQAYILCLRTIRCQHTNPFWTPDPGQVTLISWRSDGGCWHSRARADSPTHSRLTGIGLWGIAATKDISCYVTLRLLAFLTHILLYIPIIKNIWFQRIIRPSDNDSTGFWPPDSLHTLGAGGHI